MAYRESMGRERVYYAMLTDEMLDFYNHKIKDIGSM